MNIDRVIRLSRVSNDFHTVDTCVAYSQGDEAYSIMFIDSSDNRSGDSQCTVNLINRISVDEKETITPLSHLTHANIYASAKLALERFIYNTPERIETIS